MSFIIEAFIQILLLSLLPCLAFCSISLNTLTPNLPIRDGDVLVSSNKTYALGFFSPGKSRYRYVGVWFNNVPKQTIVWVANRDNPINDFSGVLSINGDGGLVIRGKDRISKPVWSANVTLASPNSSIAKLLDTGNLVLLESESSQRVMWQGFDQPSDTFLPSMKVGLNRQSGLDRFLTSWKSKDDPGTGSCKYGLDLKGLPQLFLYKDGSPLWRGGPWIGYRWSGVATQLPALGAAVGLYNQSFVNNDDEISYMYVVDNVTTRGVIDESGTFRRLIWKNEEWIEVISYPNEWCDNYGQCGPNSYCDSSKDVDDDFVCTCLPGFEPKSPRDSYWKVGVDGCIRQLGVSVCRNGERFVKVSRLKVPDSSTARVNISLSLKDCELKCLMDCSCTAYTSADVREGGRGCVTWYGDLLDIRTYSNVGQDLYVRVDAICFDEHAKSNGSLSKKATLGISLGSVTVLLVLLLALYWLVRMKMKGKRRRNEHSIVLTAGSPYFEESSGETAFDDSRINSELVFFHLKTITTATNHFSNENKLGQGGFGSVYKGILYDGKEIAVKRLSQFSGQGVEEFKNEVLLIAKLQHRNLVRVLGCCVEDEEKIIVFEYLPNKSLDSFIFNETKSAQLNWTKRFEIIIGIARGVLYLHEDSRLRIIHRDLKASNVLLDNSMNPKIADFGMARMFRGEQNEANTNRVVGTYGYMSPEYAMEGLFSTKSDVYSFGVLLLEIITGKKNTGYYHEKYPNSNLVGHVWELWNEDRAREIIDSAMGESYLVTQVISCIQIALLCVQEFATDRPTTSAVVSMLGNDAALPSPRRPAFLLKQMSHSGDPSNSEGTYSVNDVTCTIVEGR